MRCAPALLKVSTVHLAPSSERPAATQSLLPSIGATKPSSETDIFRTSEAMRCFLSGTLTRREAGSRSGPPSTLLVQQLCPDVRLEHLADARARKFLPDLHLLGRLHGPDPRLHERDQFVGFDLGARLDHRGDPLAPFVVGQPDDRAVAHR